MKSIFIFGDSVSKGIMWDQARSKYQLLRDSFVNLFSQRRDVTIKNYARLGCTVEKGKSIMEKHLDQLKQADFVVFEFGGNDCDYDWPAIAENPDLEHKPKTPIDTFIDCYTNMVVTVKEAGRHLFLLNLPPIDAQKYFAYISRGVNGDNILKWLGGRADYIYRWHEMYSLEVNKLAMALSVPLIDIRSHFLKRKDYSDLICADGIHPNQEGHRLITNAIDTAVDRFIATNAITL